MFANGLGCADSAIISEIRRLNVVRDKPFLVALDGQSGVGKSTLAMSVAARVGGTVVESDDFYAGGTDAEWAQQSAKQKVQTCINWRCLKAEALDPLLAGRNASWRPFDFATGTGLAAHTVEREPRQVVVLDGVYSARPELKSLADLAFLIEAPSERTRRQRLIERQGKPFMDAWHALGDEPEEYYFNVVCPPGSFDLVIQAE